MEDYTYDAEGNLLKTVDTDPFHNNKKSTKYEYRYDAEGNLVSEYKRDTTAGNKALTTTYTYDGLNRITSAHEEGVGLNTTRTYQYDSLGNLIREEQDGCVEYKYNGFALDESTKCGTIPNSIGTSFWEYTYDGRGNLVSNDKYTRTTSGMAWQNEETYVYDETNHMVDGKNELGERSLYTYNGLGLWVGRELIMKDYTHGYTDFHDQTPSVETGIDKPEVVKESYVIDYTSPTFQTLVMEEEGGFDDRWVYGLDKLSVKITSEGTNWWGQNVKTDILKDYLHQDRLGSTTNLTDKFGRMVGRADYNEWGEVTYKEALSITSSYRRIYPQLNYTGHDWDDVLEMYYAKARFYDPDAKRFVELDPVKGQVTDPLSLVSYLYCKDNPLRWVDPLGLVFIEINRRIGSLYSISGTHFEGGKKEDQYISLTDFVNFINSAYADPFNPYKKVASYAGGDYFTFNGTRYLLNPLTIKEKKGEYFIKFECLQDLANKAGIGKVTNKYTSAFSQGKESGQIAALREIRTIMNTGSMRWLAKNGTFVTIYFKDYAPNTTAKNNVKVALKEYTKAGNLPNIPTDAGDYISALMKGGSAYLTLEKPRVSQFLNNGSEVAVLVSMLIEAGIEKENNLAEERTYAKLVDATAVATAISEGFEFYLLDSGKNTVIDYAATNLTHTEYNNPTGDVRTAFVDRLDWHRNEHAKQNEAFLSVFGADFEEAYQAQFDKVINYNRDGSIIAKKLNEIKKRWLWDEKDTVEENLKKRDAFWDAVNRYGR